MIKIQLQMGKPEKNKNDKALNIGGISFSLFDKLNSSIQEYVNIFCVKHQLDFDYWVSDLIGTVGCFSNEYYEYYIDFETIRLDLEKDVKKGVFFDWYYKSLDSGMKEEPIINYYTYLKMDNSN